MNLSRLRKREPGYIRTGYQSNPKFGTMLLLAIVDRKSFPEFGRRRPYDVI
jgi:hypothetical protein